MGLLTSAGALSLGKTDFFGSSVKQLGGSPGVGLLGSFQQSQFGFVLQFGAGGEHSSSCSVLPVCVSGGSAGPSGAVNVCVVSWTALK